MEGLQKPGDAETSGGPGAISQTGSEAAALRDDCATERASEAAETTAPEAPPVSIALNAPEASGAPGAPNASDAPAEPVESDAERRFPLIMRIFGVLLILAGLSNIGTYVFAALYSSLAVIFGEALETFTIATMVIAIVYLVLMAAVSIAQITLGVRLLRSRHRGVALACKFMAIAQTLALVCGFMLSGLSVDLISPIISIVLLAVLESYADPTLRQERRESRRERELADKKAQEEGTLGRDMTGKGYVKLDFFNIFWVFVVCCVIGLILEIIWHMVVVEPGVYEDRAGLLYGPFSPIYGVGGALITIFLNRFYKSNPLVVFPVAGLIGATFEFLVSWWMEFSFGIKAWDYSGTFLNIDGRTNFMFFCIWGALGLVWLRWVLPWLLKLINRIPWNWRYGVTSVAFVLMLTDCILTVASFDCWYQRQAGTMATKQLTAIDEFCNEHYPDEFMEGRFESMTMDPEAAARLN